MHSIESANYIVSANWFFLVVYILKNKQQKTQNILPTFYCIDSISYPFELFVLWNACPQKTELNLKTGKLLEWLKCSFQISEKASSK